MQGKTRWGILGPGTISQKLATALKAIPDTEITAVGSRDLQRANAFGNKFRIPHRHGNYADLAHNPEVDVIYVATPHPFHKECAMFCLEAGKAVLCEKPLTVDAKQAEELIVCARQNNQFLMEAMWTRFLPVIVKVQEWLAEGAIGEPRLLTADKASRQTLSTEILEGRLFNPELGGGGLLDVGVYTIALASMVFGAPAQIRSLAHIGETDVDEQASILLGYDAGQIANLFCAIRTETPSEARITGTKGSIHIPEFWQATSATLTRTGRDPVHIEIPFKSNGFENQAMEVINCLREGKLESDVMPLDESLSIMRTMDTIRSQWGLKYPKFKSVFATPENETGVIICPKS
ncbi:Gfo/Idh/MocA family oxidoreductase [Candidatus Poribacteria bacterium]|nr:Gfo/Idh/MocA family oxidoreductase [Candidatus Poribacteria bacterium]